MFILDAASPEKLRHIRSVWGKEFSPRAQASSSVDLLHVVIVDFGDGATLDEMLD